MLGPGGLARWTAEADARVREGAWGAYVSRPVVDLTSDRPPDPERDIVLWRDGLARTAGFSGFGGALRVPPRARTTRDAAQLSESYGDEAVDEASGDEHDAPSTVELTRGAPRELRDETLSRKEKEEEGVAARVSATRLSAALRRLAAPSAFAATRAVAAHSLDALDRRIAGTARRARATRDETTAALAVSALRERARDYSSRRPSRAPSSETVVCGQPSTFLPATDADDASSLSSFAAADSDDGERNVTLVENETSRRTPKAPPFPAPARETARAFLWAEKRAGEACAQSAGSPPASALERFHGSAFFLTQRLDAATRTWRRPSASRAGETEEDEITKSVAYPAAASAAVARARARREASKKATRREDREATARESGHLGVSRRGAPARRRVEDLVLRNPTSQSRARAATVGPASSARRRAADSVDRIRGDRISRGIETNRKQRRSKRVVNKRRFGDEDSGTKKKINQPGMEDPLRLPANATRVLDLAWNPSATPPPDGATGSASADDESLFGPKPPKPLSLLPYSPANADACARAGTPASSRRLRDWCAYAGLATRAEATDGHRANALKRAYVDALRAIEELAPGVTAAAAAVTATETKTRHAEARARTGTFGETSARRGGVPAAAVFKPSDDDVGRRRNPRWKT